VYVYIELWFFLEEEERGF